MKTRQIGDVGENAVCDFLKNLSYTIVKRNYTIKGGEIDIIAEKDDFIAFVEVKTRVDNSLVSGFEAITKSKKARIIKTAQRYYINNCNKLQPRFDIAIVTTRGNSVVNIDYIENAYDISDMNIIF